MNSAMRSAGKWVVLCAATAMVLQAPAVARAGHFAGDADFLARMLVARTTHLAADIAALPQCVGQQHLAHDARDLAEQAVHLRELLLHGGSPEHIRGDLHALEVSLDHLKQVMRTTRTTPHIIQGVQSVDRTLAALGGLLRRGGGLPGVVIGRPVEVVPGVPLRPLPGYGYGYPRHGRSFSSRGVSVQFGQTRVNFTQGR